MENLIVLLVKSKPIVSEKEAYVNSNVCINSEKENKIKFN